MRSSDHMIDLPLVTLEWLYANEACQEGIDWFKEQGTEDFKEITDRLLKKDRLDWLNWLLARYLSEEDRIRYAIYAAELVLHIYEEKCPDDKRPAKAIQAAKDYLAGKATQEDCRDAARAAAASGYAATYAASGYAADAAAAVADTAYAAACAATRATYVAYATAYAAADAASGYAAYATAYAAGAAAYNEKLKQICKYGIKLIIERASND